MIEIQIIKKKHLVGVAVVSIVAIVTLAVYFTVLTPTDDFEIKINSINPEDLGVEEWLEDFQALYDFVEGNYPFLDVKNRTHGYNWLDLKSSYEERIANVQNNQEFLEIIMAALNALQNRHTWVIHPTEVEAMARMDIDNFRLNEIFTEEVADVAPYWRPLYEYVYNNINNRKFNALIVYDRGEYVVREYNSSWRTKYGDDTTVTHVNGVPIDDAIKTLSELSYIDCDFVRNKNYVWNIKPNDFGNNAIFTIENSTGYVDNVTFDVDLGWAGTPYEYPATLFSTNKYENESIGYMYVGSFGDGIDVYYDQVLNFYQDIEDYDHLIIDIRGNIGGFYTKWIEGIVRPLLHETTVHNQYFAYRTSDYASQTHSYMLPTIVPKEEFSYLPPEVLTDDFRIHKNWMTYEPLGELNFTGEIVVLMDNMVYSAAEGFVNFCKEYNFAKLYGTTSGGDGIMIRPLNFVLPNSKLVINSASAIGLDATGHANEEVRTQPDAYYESAFGNWDELINFVIEDLLNN